jgi:hypothetical protein
MPIRWCIDDMPRMDQRTASRGKPTVHVQFMKAGAAGRRCPAGAGVRAADSTMRASAIVMTQARSGRLPGHGGRLSGHGRRSPLTWPALLAADLRTLVNEMHRLKTGALLQASG